MNNESRAIARVSTSGMLWTTWNLEDHRRRTAYAPSKPLHLRCPKFNTFRVDQQTYFHNLSLETYLIIIIGNAEIIIRKMVDYNSYKEIIYFSISISNYIYNNLSSYIYNNLN